MNPYIMDPENRLSQFWWFQEATHSKVVTFVGGHIQSHHITTMADFVIKIVAYISPLKWTFSQSWMPCKKQDEAHEPECPHVGQRTPES